jgi:hypothetical protein
MLEWSAHTNFRFMPLQIAKLCIIPVLCILEILFDKVRYSRNTKLSIVLVLVGVAVCTVTDVSVNSKGLLAAVIAVWSTALQQHYVHHLQKKYSLGSFNLLGHTAPAQAASLLILGPFVDFWLTNRRVDTFNYTTIVTVCDSCFESVLCLFSCELVALQSHLALCSYFGIINCT